MFFTKAGIIVGWVVFVLGVMRVVMGIAIAYLGDQSLAPEYLGSRTTGQAINQGQWAILVGIGLGILAEISRSVASKDE